MQYYKKAKIRRDIYFSFKERILTIIEHAGSVNIAEVDLVDVAILVLMAFADHQVTSQKLTGN